MKYSVIQHGMAVWGVGETIDGAIADANRWLDENHQITDFADHDHLGALGGLTDWTNGRRYPVCCGDMLITDDPDIMVEAE